VDGTSVLPLFCSSIFWTGIIILREKRRTENQRNALVALVLLIAISNPKEKKP